jgi:hypothetical protein
MRNSEYDALDRHMDRPLIDGPASGDLLADLGHGV